MSKKKKLIKREDEIHIRVTDKEKKVLERSAKRAGLSLSAFLRMSALQQRIISKPSEALSDCYRTVEELRQTFRNSTQRSIEQRLNYLKERLLVAYHEQEADSGGGNQNMGD